MLDNQSSRSKAAMQIKKRSTARERLMETEQSKHEKVT